MSELLDFPLAGMDQPQADQLTSLAKGLPAVNPRMLLPAIGCLQDGSLQFIFCTMLCAEVKELKGRPQNIHVACPPENGSQPSSIAVI
eukprot:882613-Pelagomonas_calceolata.AAC.6